MIGDGKTGIEFIIDRVEALRVRIDSTREAKAEPPMIGDERREASFDHWMTLCVEAKTEAIKLQRALDRISASLALPPDADPSDLIAAAVKTCVQRCQLLEKQLIEFQDAHTYTPSEETLKPFREALARDEDAYRGVLGVLALREVIDNTRFFLRRSGLEKSFTTHLLAQLDNYTPSPTEEQAQQSMLPAAALRAKIRPSGFDAEEPPLTVDEKIEAAAHRATRALNEKIEQLEKRVAGLESTLVEVAAEASRWKP